MFKFNEVYQRAINDTASLQARWSNGRRCIFKYARLIGHNYNGTLSRFSDICNIDPNSIIWGTIELPSPEILVQFLTTIKYERARFIEKYKTYITQRNLDKQSGHLHAPAYYLRQLHAPDYYDTRCIPLSPWMEQGKYGYIDRNGQFVIVPQFDWAEPFAFGKAMVRIQEQIYTVDTDGKLAHSNGCHG